MKQTRIHIGGQVQGVGFRPFVYRLALELGIRGQVSNTAEGVIIFARGENMDAFLRRLRTDAPPLARITHMDAAETDVPETEEAGQDSAPCFRIVASGASEHGGHTVLVSPDVCVCDDCLRELFNPADRRYLYPFINCTNCGPRYTITRSIPYDRAVTSMACFPLCPTCEKEYNDPLDRRFHAQPNACPVCGPQVWVTSGGEAASPLPLETDPRRAMAAAAKALAAGNILALRGLGGFHLACDARCEEAIQRLRERKHRPHKAFAVMVADLEAVRRFARVSDAEARLLLAPERPIVLLERRDLPSGPDALPASIAPDVRTVGVMLPSTPLHAVLLHEVRGLNPAVDALVMTSGNAAGAPICLGNRQAVRDLAGFADLFLLHNRDILVRADDSVLRVVPETGPLLFRRARGYVPSPLPVPHGPSLLGTGAHLKATLCCTRGAHAFVSQHIGDMESPEVDDFYLSVRDHLLRLLETRPEAVVCDAHPDYRSTRLAERFAADHGLPLFTVQHHVAHHHAVLGEHAHAGPALGLMLDGTGFGLDGTIWGGELLLSVPGEPTRRVGRLAPFPLPGGDRAIREPWRLAVGLAAAHNLALPEGCLAHPQTAGVQEAVRAGLGLRTSSCGRLFDAVAAGLGLCEAITYEGQAAIRLEEAQDCRAVSRFLPPVHERELLELDSAALFAHVLAISHAPTAARVFHLALMAGLTRMARVAADTYNVTTVALGGGSFQNRTLMRELPPLLRGVGLTPLFPIHLPPGDAAVSYGQVHAVRAKAF